MLLLHLEQNPFAAFANQIAQQTIQNNIRVKQFRKQIESVLNPKCPRCKEAFGGFAGCFAVKCGCGCGFCGFCFQDCGGDAHEHCRTKHGAYFFSYDVYQRNFGARAAQEVRALLAQANPELREALSALIPAILKNNEFFITPQQILDNPRQDAPRQQGVRIESAALLCEVLNCSGYAAAALFHDNNNIDWKEEVFGPLQGQC